jgi:hypothetical protein
MGTQRKDAHYYRIDYTARVARTGELYRPNAVFVPKEYRTPEGAIRNLRSIMNRDARLHGIAGPIDVEIHCLAQSNEDEYHAEIALSMQAFQKHAYRNGVYTGGVSTPAEHERRVSTLRRERRLKPFRRIK